MLEQKKEQEQERASSQRLAGAVLALVLGKMAESSFRQSMLLSDGSLSIFWANPLVGSIAGLAIVMLLWPLWGVAQGYFRARENKGIAA